MENLSVYSMNRREAVRNVTFLLGGAITATSLGVFTKGCIPIGGEKEVRFTDSHEATLTEIADTIIPDSDIPGAKAAGVGSFIVMMMKDCYTQDVQKIFIEGLEKVDKISASIFNKSFIALTNIEREGVLEELRNEAKIQKEKNISESIKDAPPHFFQLATELTYLGYYSSEIGATQALNYIHIPGTYDGCVALKSGQRAWAI